MLGIYFLKVDHTFFENHAMEEGRCRLKLLLKVPSADVHSPDHDKDHISWALHTVFLKNAKLQKDIAFDK